MTVQDRGSIKWTSLMLPEHVEMLKEVFVEYKEKPILDEQTMLEIDQSLKYALTYNVDIVLTYYEHGQFKVIEGKLAKIERFTRQIVLSNDCGTYVPLKNVLDVQIVS